MASTAPVTPDFKNQPYWWDRAKPVPLPPQALPASVDVAVIGSGYTGLSAALTLARAGRRVLVLDRDDPGFGASRRNAGYLGRTLKKSFPQLLERKGLDYALAVYRELDAALQTTRQLIESEGIDCHMVKCGRFIGATSPAHYDGLARDLEVTQRYLGFDFHMVSRAEQRSELATDLYYGGAVLPELGSVHPGLYHLGLLERVVAAGVVVRGGTEVTGISMDNGSGKVVTAAGTVTAREIVVATNGYTPRQFAWQSRRVIPFTGFMAATEILPDDVFARQIPHGRTVIDSNVNIDFVRPAPDSNRILVGGSTGSRLETAEEIAIRLQQIIGRVLPDLAKVRFSHVWSGQCAGTFDMMPHVGRHGGIWFGLGYNFAGVPMGTYFGRKIAEQILGRPEGKSVFGTTPVPTLPFYRGNPWFVPHVMRYFDWCDGRQARISSGGMR